MAVTGAAIIKPSFTSTGIKHTMHDIVIDVPAGQDGVWSAPAIGTRVSDITVTGGDGTEGFGMKIGASSDADYGIYRGLDLIGPQHGILTDNLTQTIVSDCLIRIPRKHGIFLTDSDENMFNNILISRPGFGASDTYDGIFGSFSDDNQFNNIMMPDSVTTMARYAVNFEASYDNQVNAGQFDAGLTATFHESTYLDNDFGLDMTVWSLAKVIDTTGTGLLQLPFGADCEVYAIEIRLAVAPTGSSVIVDVNKNGTSIFPTTTKPTIPTSGTSNAALPDTTFVSAGQYLTVDIDQADSAGDAEGLTVTARWRRV